MFWKNWLQSWCTTQVEAPQIIEQTDWTYAAFFLGLWIAVSAVVLSRAFLMRRAAAIEKLQLLAENPVDNESVKLNQANHLVEMRCNKLLQEVKSLQQQLNGREAYIAEMELQSQQLEETIKQSQTIQDGLHRRNEALARQCSVQLETIRQMASASAAADLEMGKAANLSIATTQQTEQIAALSSTIMQLQKNATLQEQLFADLHSQKEKLENKLDELELQRSQSQVEVSQLREKLKTQQTATASAESSLAAHKEELHELKKLHRSHEAKQVEWQKERAELVDAVQQLKNGLRTSQAMIENVERDRNALQSHLGVLKAQCQAFEASAMEHLRNCDLLSQEVRDLRESQSAQVSRERELREEIETLNNLNATYLHTIQTWTMGIAERRSSLAIKSMEDKSPREASGQSEPTQQKNEVEQLRRIHDEKSQEQEMKMQVLIETITVMQKELQEKDALLDMTSRQNSGRTNGLKAQVIGLNRLLIYQQAHYNALLENVFNKLDSKEGVLFDSMVRQLLRTEDWHRLHDQLNMMADEMAKERSEYETLKMKYSAAKRLKRDYERRLTDYVQQVERTGAFIGEAVGHDLKVMNTLLLEMRNTVSTFLTKSVKEISTASSRAAVSALLKGCVTTINSLRLQVQEAQSSCNARPVLLPCATANSTPRSTPPDTPRSLQPETPKSHMTIAEYLQDSARSPSRADSDTSSVNTADTHASRTSQALSVGESSLPRNPSSVVESPSRPKMNLPSVVESPSRPKTNLSSVVESPGRLKTIGPKTLPPTVPTAAVSRVSRVGSAMTPSTISSTRVSSTLRPTRVTSASASNITQQSPIRRTAGTLTKSESKPQRAATTTASGPASPITPQSSSTPAGYLRPMRNLSDFVSDDALLKNVSHDAALSPTGASDIARHI